MKVNKKPSKVLYQRFLEDVLTMVQNHQIVAVQSVQAISNQLYWNIGELILKMQQEHGWGKSIIEILSTDLQHHIGKGVSWSSRNLWLMRQLVDDYSNMKQAVSDLNNHNTSKVKQPVSDLEKFNISDIKKLISEVPWGHNILILQKVKDINARIFYLQTTIKNKYSRSLLLHQIKADSYQNYLKNPSQNNFSKILPSHLLEQTKESIKSVYSLDFLDINLLFYHRIPKCLVAVELKVAEFEPEFVGKLDFYLQLVDEQLKQPDDKPSIGILLVPYKDRLEVEYALKSASKPIGVAEYKISKKLPRELKGKLPSIEDFKNIL